jgi:hypothetical protein
VTPPPMRRRKDANAFAKFARIIAVICSAWVGSAGLNAASHTTAHHPTRRRTTATGPNTQERP